MKTVDSKILSNSEVLNLYNTNQIKFLKRYDDKFKERFK